MMTIGVEQVALGQGSGNLEAALRKIGTSDNGADQLAKAYVGQGPAALLFAATSVVAEGGDEAKIRGARLVMMSLERIGDFAFLKQLSLEPYTTERSCATNELLGLIGQSAESVDVKRAKGQNDSDRLPFIQPFAELLIRIVDQPWPPCVVKNPRVENDYCSPPVVALDLLNRMFHWNTHFDLSFCRGWGGPEGDGPAQIRKFKAWWKRHSGRYLKRPRK